MAIVANTFQQFQAIGVREDLSDIIYNVSPTECPFLQNAGRGKVQNTFFEWQTDLLANAVTTNQQIEGDDISAFDAVTPTVRLGNYTNIARKTVIISDTEEVVDKAGRHSEISYQIAKKGKELKRDMETALTANVAAAAGSTGAARVTGSILAFIKTNTDIGGGGGANPVYTNIPNATRTDGTQRSFTETILKNVIQQTWVSGGNPKTLMVGALGKQVTSGFSGIAEKIMQQTAPEVTAIIGAADAYVSDFGTLAVVPNRFMRSRDGLVLDWDFISVDYLRPFKQEPLAKTGDAEKRMLIVEFGLRVKNEKALGIAADLTP